VSDKLQFVFGLRMRPTALPTTNWSLSDTARRLTTTARSLPHPS